MSSFTQHIPRSLKNLVPGYRAKWQFSYAALLMAIGETAPGLTFSDKDGVPEVHAHEDDIRLLGLWTGEKDGELYDNLRSDLPANLTRDYFRLMRDYLTRYCFPHLRPDLKPYSMPAEQMTGFHGQQKDSIHDMTDPDQRDFLLEKFALQDDDVIIDCGAFLGFGEVRLAPALKTGRIIALEASADCHAVLKKNIEANEARRNVTPLHAAIWNEVGEMELESGYAQDNSLVTELVHHGKHSQVVETLTVDSIVERFDLDRVSMLSLTVNGAEVEGLLGADKTLRKMRPRIRLAGWYYRGDRRIADIAAEILLEYDYQTFIGPRGNTMAVPK
jgi:FkbM family methyltransferase